MIAAGACALAFWACCAALSALSRPDRPILQGPFLFAAAASVYFALASLVAWTFIRMGHPFVTVPGFVFVLVLGTLLAYSFWASLIGEFVDCIHGAATGLDAMKVERTYDRAAKLEREGDLDGALAAYEDAAAKDARDPEPRRRMAEIHLRRGEADRAFERFREALALLEGDEDRASLAFRLSDLLVEAGRIAEAKAVLEDASRALVHTRFAGFARTRRAALDPSPTRNRITEG